MIVVAIHSFQDKQRYNTLCGLWEFPGTRVELIADWQAGRFPESSLRDVDVTVMPPQWTFAYGESQEAYQGTYVQRYAHIMRDVAYARGMSSAQAVVEIGDSWRLKFRDQESFDHPICAPRPDDKVESDHLVWQCPGRAWLRAFVRGRLAVPHDPFDTKGDVRWIEGHLARCQECFRRAAQMSCSIPCPDPDEERRPYTALYDGLRYDVEFHVRTQVCRKCA